MFRGDVERTLRAEYGEGDALFPAYGSYCFGNVPDTVRSLLDAGGERPLPGDVFDGVDTAVETVVLVVVDGYGLEAWKRDRADHAILNALAERGTVTPLTAVYPSETAAAITTVETGQLPCEHGRVGWNVYEPSTDRAFLALSGETKAGDAEGGVADEAWAGVDYHYTELADAGVDCHRLQPFATETAGVTHHTYDGLDAFAGRLSAVLADSDDPGYVYAYLPQADHAAHRAGTESEAFDAAVAGVCEQLSAFVDGLDAGTAARTLLLVTADHGHVDTDPGRNVDLSANPTVMANLRRHADGTPVRLAGSPRNVHLHLREGTVAETREALGDLDARTFTREEALDRGLFGDRPATDRFRRRCGDLVVAHRELGAWFGDVEPDELEQVGMHGGLAPAEMLVPFAAARLPALR